MLGVRNSGRFFSTSTRCFQENVLKSMQWESKLNISALKKVINAESKKPTEDKIKISPNFSKRFTSEEVYDPFDFSFARHELSRREHLAKLSRNQQFLTSQIYGKEDKHMADPFKRTKINPLNLFAFSDVLRYYISETGRIYHRDVNVGISARNQKKLAKAIRRARAIGALSNVSKIGMDSPRSSYQMLSTATGSRKALDFNLLDI